MLHYHKSKNTFELIIYSYKDKILPLKFSISIYQLAQQPKQLVIYKDAKYSLESKANDILKIIKKMILQYLG